MTQHYTSQHIAVVSRVLNFVIFIQVF